MMLAIHHLAFERYDENLFEDLNFQLQAGETLQICGANGSGKSTLLRILAGLLEPHRGNIFWHNKNIFQQLSAYQAQINFISHQQGLKNFLTAAENMQFIMALREKINADLTSTQKIFYDAILNFPLTPVSQLSAGQKRRLALARLVLYPSKIWLLDEPITALDQATQVLFFELVTEFLQSGGMVVLTSHHEISQLPNIKKLELAVDTARNSTLDVPCSSSLDVPCTSSLDVPREGAGSSMDKHYA